MKALRLIAALLSLSFASFSASASEYAPCTSVTFEGADYTVCTLHHDETPLRLFLQNEADEVFGNFSALENDLNADGETLIFAINGGMYHDSRVPVGLYIEGGVQRSPLQLRANNDNFGMVPNGVFYIEGDALGVMESHAFKAAELVPDYATQSGPMLVIDGTLHPRFRIGSTSVRVRNGVGVLPDGQTAVFVVSDAPVNFHSFARLFRDHLGAPNALYLDGVVSKLYAPHLLRHDRGLPMGPIVGAVVPLEADGA